jgi:uncharacterized protein YecE (DUF72 family)
MNAADSPSPLSPLRTRPWSVNVPVLVATSGYQYRHWRGRFYPEKPRVKDDLAFFADHFQTVELNSPFYRLPGEDTFASWASRTPDDFVFAVKASRYLTHIKRLADPDEPVQRFLERASRLGSKLGPVLLQLPPTLKRDVDRLNATLAAFPKQVRLAVEFRHGSWYTDEVRDTLSEHGAALCLVDRGSRLVTPEWRTADWGYMRFHWGTAKPESCYGLAALAARARLIAELWRNDEDVHVYFNNDAHACALRDAIVFARFARRLGLITSRVPDTSQVRVGDAVRPLVAARSARLYGPVEREEPGRERRPSAHADRV